jgi:hypothetical protein
MYSSVAYYYALEDPLRKLAVLDVEGPLTLTSSFEGRNDVEELSDSGRMVDASSKFEMNVPWGYSRLRLRRLFDRATVQDAEVWVNGKRAGVWYNASRNPHHRWGETDFLLPESLTHGAERLEIEMRPVQSGWNEF